ncbi:response regulator [Patescibacteria group bacterium]|nr:response regulator [Patescibacteria group bacterium]MBU0963729.1 response regulator [Patescibacteria group bacterium]
MPGSTQVKKILIVDDEEPIRVFLRSNLKNENINILEASNGEDGLSLALKERPQLILLDVIMPKMHGIEVLNRLRGDEWGKNVHVILVTNYAQDPRVVEAIDKDLCELLEKGRSTIEDIVSRVKDILEI